MLRNRIANNLKSFSSFFILFTGALIVLCASCSAQPAMSEEVALRSLRETTVKGKLPPESVVQNIESRFSGTSTGALARLLRARIRLEAGDPMVAASLLQSDQFARVTELADYALWLLGKALVAAGNSVGAQTVFGELVSRYPTSMRARDARLMWAQSLSDTGKHERIPGVLTPLIQKNDGEALLITSESFEKRGQRDQAFDYLRKAYFLAAGSKAGDTAKMKLAELGDNLEPRESGEILARAKSLFAESKYREAVDAYEILAGTYPEKVNDAAQLERIVSYSKIRQLAPAGFLLEKMNPSSELKAEAFYHVANGFANTRDWPSVSRTIAAMRARFPRSAWTPKAMVAVGNIAGKQKRFTDKNFYLRSTLSAYPNSVENVDAHFELAWNQHELKRFAESSKLLTEHLARYVDKDTSYRGRSGYWAARDSERAGKIAAACALYDATVYRYGANWYGYQALQRLVSLRRRGKCQTTPQFPVNSLVPKAVKNLKIVTVAAETATKLELDRARKSDQLSTVGLFDWAIEELKEAKKSADNSPSINLALAKHYRLKGDNVRALLALKVSYPDYSQMFPEEMGREEWDIFYPLIHWNDIKYWAKRRNLDPYNVAGLIRQETIFDPDARSRANAYGLMQLLVPTARSMARKYGAKSSRITASSLYHPPLNIELGTAYMREQLSKYGRIEYMSVAYNAGPGRVVSWRRKLPLAIDEFVEEIPFGETRGYVKGIIRNSAQYRRLYDISGKFKSNVGANPIRAGLDKLTQEQFASENPEIRADREKKIAD